MRKTSDFNHTMKDRMRVMLGVFLVLMAVLLPAMLHPSNAAASETQQAESAAEGGEDDFVRPNLTVRQNFSTLYTLPDNLGSTFTYVLTGLSEDAPLPAAQEDGKYSFTLTGDGDAVTIPITLDGSGDENTIKLTHAGVYEYDLKQDQTVIPAAGEDGEGYKLDNADYIVRIYVRNENNGLVLEGVTAQNRATQAKGDLIFSNSYSGDRGTSLKVVKQWEKDPLNITEDVASVTFTLQRTETPADPESWQNGVAKQMTKGEDGSWEAVFEGLDAYTDDGRALYYRALETSLILNDEKGTAVARGEIATSNTNVVTAMIGGYEMTSSTSGGAAEGYVTTVVNTPVTGKIQAVKFWNDQENVGGKRPGTVAFVLKKNGKELGSEYERVLDGQASAGSADKANMVVWDNLPVMNADGTPAVYTVEEKPVEGYQPEGGATVELKAEKTKSITQVVSGILGKDDGIYALDAEADFTNVRDRMTLEFNKTVLYDEADSKAALAGASFGFYLDQACTQPVKDVNGKAVTAVSGQDGKVSAQVIANDQDVVYIKELAAGKVNIKPDDTVYMAKFRGSKMTGLTTADGKAIKEIVNTVYRTELEFVKTDALDPTMVVAGAEFGLYRYEATMDQLLSRTRVKEGEEVEIATAVSDRNGVVKFTNLIPGQDYILRELTQADGYAIPYVDVSVIFSVDQSGKITMKLKTEDGDETAELINSELYWREPRMDIGILKTDPDGNILPGAELKITTADGKVVYDVGGQKVDVFTTTEMPTLLEGLRDGDYLLVEIKAPAGFQIAEAVPFTIRDGMILGSESNTVEMVDPIAVTPTPTPDPDSTNSGNNGGGSITPTPGTTDSDNGGQGGNSNTPGTGNGDGTQRYSQTVNVKTGDSSNAKLWIGLLLAAAAVAAATIGFRRKKK